MPPRRISESNNDPLAALLADALAPRPLPAALLARIDAELRRGAAERPALRPRGFFGSGAAAAAALLLAALLGPLGAAQPLALSALDEAEVVAAFAELLDADAGSGAAHELLNHADRIRRSIQCMRGENPDPKSSADFVAPWHTGDDWDRPLPATSAPS